MKKRRTQRPVRAEEAIHDFVGGQRGHVTEQQEIVVALAFSQVGRYVNLLRWMESRYRKLGARLLRSNDETFNRTPPTWRAWERRMRITSELNVLIESFYLLAKITLDKAAIALQAYFGNARGIGLHRHSVLAKKLTAYAADRGLAQPAPAQRAICEQLQRDISDFRDDCITHNIDPTKISGLLCDRNGIASIQFPSSLGIPNVTSRPLGELLELIDDHVAGLIAYADTNRHRAKGRMTTS